MPVLLTVLPVLHLHQVQVATRDHLIPPAMQFELAKKLHAKTVTFPSGEYLRGQVDGATDLTP